MYADASMPAICTYIIDDSWQEPSFCNNLPYLPRCPLSFSARGYLLLYVYAKDLYVYIIFRTTMFTGRNLLVACTNPEVKGGRLGRDAARRSIHIDGQFTDSKTTITPALPTTRGQTRTCSAVSVCLSCENASNSDQSSGYF